jgi:hypothetical protein
MVCSREFYLEPKMIIDQMVTEAGVDADDGKRIINFDVVDLGETVEAD